MKRDGYRVKILGDRRAVGGGVLMKVSLFIPCLVDQFLPEIGEATARLLVRLGARVDYDPRQTCCGQPLINAGRTDEARRAALHFIEVFGKEERVVAPSGSCVHTVKVHYPELLAGTPAHKKALGLAEKVWELSDFIVNVMGVTDVGADFGAGGMTPQAPPKVTFHHSCHVRRGLGIREEPRVLLDNVRGIEVVPLVDEDVCCGFGGEFSVGFPEVSAAMVEDKVNKTVATGAEYLVLSEPGCILNIRGYINRRGIPIRVIHTAELLCGGRIEPRAAGAGASAGRPSLERTDG
jgi:L-lactate dehydrogenase complex protein LldE